MVVTRIARMMMMMLMMFMRMMMMENNDENIDYLLMHVDDEYRTLICVID